jgi:hypothetical protein
MTIQSTAIRFGLTALLLGSALQVQAYIEQEPTTGVHNDAPSTAEDVGALAPGGFLFISGVRQSGVQGGSSADYFRFEIAPGASQWTSLTVETPTEAAMPVLGLFDNSASNLLLQSGFDNNSSSSKFLSFSYQLAPGTYYAAVSGFRAGWQDFDGGGHSGWTYNLLLNSSLLAAPVSEPESVVMLLAGLGVLGMVGRRRRG